jgi:predicted nucleotidyltransferase
MTLEQFKQQRNKGLISLKRKLSEVFSKNGIIAIHQFGSFAKGQDDEFSDLDIWITVNDKDLRKVINDRNDLYSSIGDKVITFEPPQNAPPEGMYSMVIFQTEYGFYHVDFYLVGKLKTKILPEARIIFGDDSLPRGDWFEDQKAKNIPPLNTPSSRIDFIICMAFVGVKYVVRHGKSFLDFLTEQYSINRNEYFPQLEEIKNDYDFNTIRFILDQHLKVADEKQKKAIDKLKEYLSEVSQNYG